MNAHAPITPADKARADARQLAEEILAGKYEKRGPWNTTANFTPTEWREAAQYLVDTDDCDELLHMMAVERAWDERGYDCEPSYAPMWSDADKQRMFGSFR